MRCLLYGLCYQGMNRITDCWLAACWIVLLPALAAPAPKQHELCAVCHSETVKDFLAHPHAQAGMECIACHGESVRHRTSEGHAEPDRIAAPAEFPRCAAAATREKARRPFLRNTRRANTARFCGRSPKFARRIALRATEFTRCALPRRWNRSADDVTRSCLLLAPRRLRARRRFRARHATHRIDLG